MSQSNHRKKGGGINEREPSAFIAYTYDSKTMPPCKIQSAKQKVLDEITGFARSRHPVKVHCYQWTTSNFIKERASGHLAIQQYTKAHSGCSPSLTHDHKQHSKVKREVCDYTHDKKQKKLYHINTSVSGSIIASNFSLAHSYDSASKTSL